MTQLQNVRDLKTAQDGDTIIIDGHTLSVEWATMSRGSREIYLTSDKKYEQTDQRLDVDYEYRHVRLVRPTMGKYGMAMMPVHVLIEALESGTYVIE